MRSRRLRASGRTLLFVAFAAALRPEETLRALPPENAAAGAEAAALELGPGVETERRLAGGETHSYALPAPAGGRLLVIAEQRGVDLALELRRGDGSLALAVDGPTDSEGRESLLLPPDLAGPLELRVLAPNPGAAPGTYLLRLETLPDSTPAERRRLEAERLATEAGARNRQGAAGEAAALRESAALYDAARALWHDLGRREEEAGSALAAGGVHTSLGEPKPAAERFEAALALYSTLDDAPGRAAAWTALGLARTALGDGAGAVEAQSRAQEIEERLGRPLAEGKVRNNLGFALHTRGDLRAAREHYLLALARFEEAGEHGWWEATVLQNLAAVETALGEPEEALRSHRRVLERQRALGDRRGEGQTLNNLGVLHDRRGEPGEAVAAYAAALALVPGSGDQIWEGALLHNLGLAQLRLGDPARARTSLESALALRRSTGDRPGEIRTGIALGQVFDRLGEPVPALAAAGRAAALAAAADDTGKELRARLLLARLHLGASETGPAEAELARARELAARLGDPAEEAAVLRDLGSLRLAQGQTAEAAETLERALGLARSHFGPARTVPVLSALARAERRLGRSAAARAHVEEALALIEAERAREPDPEIRAAFLASQHADYELEIDLLMEAERREPGQGYARRAFEAAERARARSLLDLLAEAGAEIREGVDPELRQRERTLLLRLQAKRQLREDLARRPAPPERVREIEADLRAVLEELTRLEGEIRRRSPRYAALTRPELPSSAAVQALLDDDTLLLELALGEERSYLWAVDRQEVAGFELPPRAEIESTAREVYRHSSLLAPRAGALDEAAARLGSLLLAPVAARLGARRLVVVADGALQSIPFALLPEPGDGAATAPLAQRHEIVYAPSATALAYQRSRPRLPPSPGAVTDALAILADPVFDRRDPRVAAPVAAGAAGTDGVSRSAGGEAGEAGGAVPQRLPWSRREAEAIAAIAAQAANAAKSREPLLALDFRASRETALSSGLAGYGILHIATHGRIDAQTPALSGLMLSRVGAGGEPVEGFLGLRDLYNLRLGAHLVVLSGCETALGKELRGEGLVGLTQAFFYAGARQVVASLWRVEDRATAELMSRFYRGLLLEGLPPAAALRQAQLAIRADRRWRDPYYWSGFVLQGDWR